MADSRTFSRQSFQEWAQSPLTQVYLRFLSDQRDQLAQKWASGEALDQRHQTKALLLGELASLEWSDYASFYGIGQQTDAD
jgi:hypothetical protein